jgi:hypothetical protein
MEFRAKQIAPPKSWDRFEDLCHSLFKQVWADPLAQKEGRRGQPQHGVDIVGSPQAERNCYHAVQCKGKDANYGSSANWDEVLAEIGKTERFSPKLDHWIFATTAPVDGKLQAAARKLSVKRSEANQFTVSVLGWEEIQALMAEHPSVVEEFYPEAAFNLPAILQVLQDIAKAQDHVSEYQTTLNTTHYTECSSTVWHDISFQGGRDLGPALMGRPLGPSDTAACPQLSEVNVIVSMLQSAYSSRLFGIPGAGKSICAYQAALGLSKQGFSVKRLVNPETRNIRLNGSDSSEKTLYLIDDAHLMPLETLELLEDSTNTTTLLLSIHNAIERQTIPRGAVFLDHERAVKTIAASLLSQREKTLEVVSRADDNIGEGMMDTSLEHRINDAEAAATMPWQFCFILGGGWRRAKQVVDAAKSAEADFVLAAIAARQIASRDEIVDDDEMISLCQPHGLNQQAIKTAIKWLASERLILSVQDCRTPHQRFAAVTLHQVLINRGSEKRGEIFRLIETILCDCSYPLHGIRNLLHELRFGHGDYRWNRMKPLQTTTIQLIADRCWRSVTHEERNVGCITLNELDGFDEDWANNLIEPHSQLLSNWISDPGTAGNGLGWLLNNLRNTNKNLHSQVVSRSSPEKLGIAFSTITPETAYGMSSLLSSVYSDRHPDWQAQLASALEKDKLLLIATQWTDTEQAFIFAKTCHTVSYCDETLALDMLDKYIPIAQEVLVKDPINGFHGLDDIAMHVLRIFDPLGIYNRKLKADARRWKIGRRICTKLDAEQLAIRLSETPKREFQQAAFFLNFLFKCAPRKFNAVVGKLNWEKISVTIGKDWENPPHEVEVLLGTLHAEKAERPAVTKFIEENASQIYKFPPRFVLMASEAAIQHVVNGREIRLVQYDHVDWDFGTYVIELFAEKRPDVLDTVISPFAGDIAKSLSRPNSSWFTDSGAFLESLRNHSPDTLRSILAKVDTATASEGWSDSLSKKGGARISAAILVDFAIELSGEIGALAQRLRKHFPSASIPKQKALPFAKKRSSR